MSGLGSWIYLYAKFSQEALILWGALTGILGASYSVFWILKKRRFGVANQAVPSSLVKGYLNELIAEARVVRGQLFGMTEDVSAPTASASGTRAGLNVGEPAIAASASVAAGVAAPAGATATAPEAAAAVTQLQAKSAEQDKTIQSLAAEKAKLEQDLAAAQAAGAKSGGGAPTAEAIELKKKVKDLEDRLNEYSIIEDDLANLKRLQQENEEFRKKLGLEPAQQSAAPAPAPAPAPAAAPAAASAQPAAPAPTPEPAPAAVAAPAAFEKVVDQVEASLAAPTPAAAQQPAAEQSAAQPAAPAPTAPDAGAAPTAPAEPKKSDEDLLSEFEKMLGG